MARPPFTDSEMAQIDRAAERRAHQECWGRTVPVPLPLPDDAAPAPAPALQHYVAWVRLAGGDIARFPIGHFASEDTATEHARAEAVKRYSHTRIEGVHVLPRPE